MPVTIESPSKKPERPPESQFKEGELIVFEFKDRNGNPQKINCTLLHCYTDPPDTFSSKHRFRWDMRPDGFNRFLWQAYEDGGEIDGIVGFPFHRAQPIRKK